ncbi:flagellar filament capping protein FliD [Thioalkalivibrio sp. AKL7]|uniref:flagellar filament capping protein FliD n=1 Tax=Thioalkalivibrio sp. AKL7 TaxID=1158155 RepID=UPI0003771D06|nr:flagellar filament capping protein FliD [Thioalkalivibrio sp. AKL7]
MAISALGVGSGLDLNQIVGDLLNAERVPKETRFNQREERIEAQISAYGNLRNGIEQLGSALGSLSGFELSQSASVSDASVASVTADGTAANGSFSLEVNQLAQAQSIASAPGDFADADAEVGAGQLEIQVGGGNAITINVEEGDTLRDLRNAINEADAGVTASIVNDGNGARLVLNANETGADNTITVSATEDPAGSGLARLDGNNLVETRAAQDAEAVINGLTVTSSSNTLDDAVEGLSIELQNTSTGPVNVSVREDQGELRQALQAFVEQYNALVGQTRELTSYNAEEDEASVLTGDSTVRGIRSRLGDALMQPAQVPDANAQTLSELGIVSNRDGTLNFDTSRFNQAMDNNSFDSIAEVVREVGGRMEGVTNTLVGADGLIGARTDGLRNDLERIGQQRERLDIRLERMEERLIGQFSRMDSAVAQMQSTGDFLTGQLANMPLAQNNSRR